MFARVYYGWWITIALAITETVSWGIIYYAFSVFITPLEQELGWSRPQVTGAFSLSLFMMAAMSFPVGYWLDRYGSRGLMTFGSISAALLIFSLSQIETLTLFYVVWALLGCTGAMVLYEPAFVVVTRWFNRYRARALAIITFAAGFASTIFLPLTEYLIRTYGRSDSWIILAIILAAITIPLHFLVLRKSPEMMGIEPDGKHQSETSTSQERSIDLTSAIRGRSFWWFALAFGLVTLSSQAIRVHFIPFLADLEYSLEFAAWLAGIIGAFQVLGRVLFAPVGERFTLKSLVLLLFVMQGFALLILWQFQMLTGIWVFVIVFGSVYGATTLARTAMLGEMYSGTHFGRISSIQAILMRIALMGAPYGAGVLYVAFGNTYQPVILMLIALSFLGVAALWQVK